MSDVSLAPEQDQVAESLLGEPLEQTAVEETGTEQQPEVQETQTVDVEADPQVENVAEDWLPSDQDKVFPDDVYARYAERYQLTPEQAADPLLRQLLHDKINSDILIRQQMDAPEAEQFEQDGEAEAAEPTQPQLPSREEYFAQIERMVAQRTDPQVAKDFHGGFLRAFGVPEAEIAKSDPQQAMAFTNLMSKYALNLFNTFAGDILSTQLPNQLSQAFPGFGDMYERSSHAMAWDRVRNSNPAYQSLPAYGSKEFSSTLRDAAAKIPGFDEMQFTDRQGKALPPMENAMRKYSMLAQAASGQNVDPVLLQRAAATAAQRQRSAQVKRAAGQLGSGQSRAASGSPGSSQFQTNSDLFDTETMAMYKKEHGRL